MMILAYRKRGLIIFLSFLTMLAILLIGNETVSLLSAGVCVLLTVSVLYRNLALLTGMTADDSRLRILRASTLFDIAVFLTGTVLSLLIASHTVTLSGQTEKALAASMVSSVMIFAGIAAPKLPHSKHTGLRLPWTVQDEDTWNAAHRMIGCISIPAALLYIACAWTVSDFAFVTLCAMIVWIGIPAGISYIFFFRKYHGIRH